MEFRSHGFRLVAGFALAIATSSAMHAQVPCLGSPERIYSGTFQGFLFVDDQDLDGDVDVGYGGGIVKRFQNDGSGLFTYSTPDIFSLPASGGGNSFSFSNLDADSLPDLTFVDSTAQQLIVVLHSSFGTIVAWQRDRADLERHRVLVRLADAEHEHGALLPRKREDERWQRQRVR